MCTVYMYNVQSMLYLLYNYFASTEDTRAIMNFLLFYWCTCLLCHSAVIIIIVTSVYSSLFVSSKFSNSGSASFWGSFSKRCLNLVQGVQWIKEYVIKSNKGTHESSTIRIVPMFEIQWTLLCTTTSTRKQVIVKISMHTMWYVLTLADL